MPTGWRTTTTLTATERLEVLDLLNRIEDEIHREAIDESRRRTIVAGWKSGHWLRYFRHHLVGYAQATGTSPLEVELAGGGVDDDLLIQLLVSAPIVEWWARDAITPDTAEVVRTLYLLEVELPVEVAPIPEGTTMRTFDPAVDSEAWLEQNNRAFAHHPEQGAWRLEDLRMRVAEPWFDPSGFLLFERDGVIVASCWTKVHELHPDRFGEIYVVSVHPDYQGHHLGVVAVTQGLNALRRKGVSRASLFVDDSNVSARALYARLGFHSVREDHLLRFRAS